MPRNEWDRGEPESVASVGNQGVPRSNANDPTIVSGQVAGSGAWGDLAHADLALNLVIVMNGEVER